MSIKKILLADNVHINRKNFGSLYKFSEKHGIKMDSFPGRDKWYGAHGNYEDLRFLLQDKIDTLRCLDFDQLYGRAVRGVNLFHVSRAEILSKLIADENWHNGDFPVSEKDLFGKIFHENKSVLLSCMAAAWDWIKFWSDSLNSTSNYSHACVFSGSLIYQRSLIEVLRYTPTKVLVMESFFTGNDYYCEESYAPISNNSSIRHPTYVKSLLMSPLSDRDRANALNKILLMKNKNVTQPTEFEEIKFDFSGPVAVVLGQVVNDFSLLEYDSLGLSSVAFYKCVIRRLVENGFNVIFKSHPWEEKKINVKGHLTKKMMTDFVYDLPPDQRARIILVDNYPIDRLFSMASFVLGLNSQSLLESVFYGLKPIQFGRAFYGGHGFTYDFSLDEIDDFIALVMSVNFSGTVSLSEYRGFEDYMTLVLQRHLVSCHDSGMSRLADIFKTDENIPLVSILPSDPKANIGRKLLKFRRNPRAFFADSGIGFIRHLAKFF